MSRETCLKCNEEIAFERATEHGIFQGRVRERCKCGTRGLATTHPAPVLRFKRGTSRNGQLTDGKFHGVCVNPDCAKKFIATYRRLTCNSEPCRLWARRRHDIMIDKECPHCQVHFQTREAKPRRCCPKKSCERAQGRVDWQKRVAEGRTGKEAR